VNAQDTSAEPKPDLPLEIAHLLLIDVIGYSKLLVNEEIELLEELNQIVRNTECFRAAEKTGKLIRMPTGDGMALLFFHSPEEPVRCALEISRTLQDHQHIQVRMGVHSGPVNRVTDVNDKTNFAGSGINVAQRVLDCGDARHILLSGHVAEDLCQYRHWQPYLHDLGECEVKHGLRLHVFNLYKDGLGNPQVPEKLKRRRWKRQAAAIRPVTLPRPPKFLLRAALVVLAVALAVSVSIFLRRGWPSAARMPAEGGPAASIPEKSIAVLPFENRSSDKMNAYFADGIQEEILTRLSKIADLKVISRTSTQHYKSAPENLPEIAKQLGVANILEGSVQKAADQVRVNVQLINALNDAHLWSDIYDRKLTDIFAVESDIAKTIADTLQAKLTGAEKQMISGRPTSDMAAYELYLKGRSLWGKRGGDNLRQAIAFYEQAIARDPSYAPAYAGLAEAYVLLPVYTAAAPGDVYPKAKAAALKALQLDDKLAEAHTALADVLYNDFDMAGSIAEFQRAIALNPNYATAHAWYGNDPLTAVGRFDEAIAEGKRAIELDPLSPVINSDLGQNLYNARRYDEAIAQLRKTLEIDPTFYYAHVVLGEALLLKGDVPAAIAEYEKARQLSDNLGPRVFLAVAKAQSGDKEAAARMLAELEELSRHRYVDAFLRALLNLSLNNREEAIRWLEQGVANHEVHLIKVHPFLDPLRGDPRFEALVQKVVGPKQK
jgi:TolB-like protein/class 3 adenylate cyclase/Tfp pilus assembly protein PilF